MPNNIPSPPPLPDDLHARLAAAGVTDDASLQAALAADPALAADLQAFAERAAEALPEIGIMALLAAFAQVEGSEQMVEFWRGVPAELEEPLMAAAAAAIAQAEEAGDTDMVEHLRPRLERFRQIHEAAEQAAELPPALRAVLAFAQAEDDAAAEALFASQKALLQPYEAQKILGDLVAQAPADIPAEVRGRLTARHALLRRLRGDAAAPPPTAPSRPLTAPARTPIEGDLYQAGGDQYLFSAHAEGGGTATVVNNLFLSSLPRTWTRPAPPTQNRDAVPRSREIRAVLDALRERASVAITGRAAKAQALAVQGAPGVGKTTLAQLLALHLAEDECYRDGVIWLELGPDFRSPDQAQAVLRSWASYATGFFGLPDNLNKLFVFEPQAVRSLLAEHPRLLVVLDNVWSLAAIQPLREALPAGSHLVITTRSRDIANGLMGGLVEVGLLSEEEAVALFDLRLKWRPAGGASGGGWAGALMKAVDFHALGLDVALGVLRHYGTGPADWEKTAQSLIAALGSGQVERLNLGDDDPGHNVKAVILFSYEALPDDETRRRFRGLAAFAPEAGFSTALAAAAWGCGEESAFETLTGYANAALLDRLGGGAWRQHGLLRAFAAALLRDAGERDQAAAAHARAYGEAMRQADDEQRYYQMLPAMPQLRQAFEWAAANDLELALSLAANCANLQQQFGLTREAGEWSERLLHAAKAGRAGPAVLPRAFGHRANRLSEIATLPGEDRRARLLQALAAYDDALQYRRPEVAPLDYAMTQNNRANRLSEIATLPGEDRRARLLQALAAYDDALQYRRPEVAPLDYAMTQNNRANRLSEIATLPGEDRRARLYDALRCSVEAVTLFEQFQQAQYLEVGTRVVRSIRDACGSDFAAMWAELGLGEPPDWLSQSLQAVAVTPLLQTFAQVKNQEQMIAFWQTVPTELEEPFMQAAEALVAQAEQAGDQGAVDHLRSRLEGFRQIHEAAASAPAIPEEQRREMAALAEQAQAYVARLEAADAERPQAADWQEVTALGEALLAGEGRGGQGVNWAALRRQLASNYNTLGNAHDSAGDPAAALAAFERAVALQPDFAMWRRNLAGTLIDLGRLGEAAAAIEAARALEPDAPRLAQLGGDLARAQEAAP